MKNKKATNIDCDLVYCFRQKYTYARHNALAYAEHAESGVSVASYSIFMNSCIRALCVYGSSVCVCIRMQFIIITISYEESPISHVNIYICDRMRHTKNIEKHQTRTNI